MLYIFGWMFSFIIFEVFHFFISWPNEMISTADIQMFNEITLPIVPKMESKQKVKNVKSSLNEDDSYCGVIALFLCETV